MTTIRIKGKGQRKGRMKECASVREVKERLCVSGTFAVNGDTRMRRAFSVRNWSEPSLQFHCFVELLLYDIILHYTASYCISLYYIAAYCILRWYILLSHILYNTIV